MGRIIITGASRGIGRAIAEKLAAPGKHIVIHGRDREALEQAAAAIKQRGAEIAIVVGDLGSTGGVEDTLRQIGNGPIETLINNAGVSVVAPVEEIMLEQWQQTLAINVTAPFMITQRLLPLMSDGSAIVNIVSVANKAAFPTWAAYTMSKAALEGFSRCLREEVRTRGIRVIDVFPAATSTELWENVPGEWARDAMLPPEEVAEAVAYALGRPKDVLVDNISVGRLGGNL